MIKLVTVLFADVVGSTKQAEHMLPEETRALMTDFFGAMSEEIRAEGGTIDRLIGDAVMADFGIPLAHEDDPVRAVRAARRMLERLAKWNSERDPESQIQIRIGINTGEVSAGGTLGEQLLVMGDAVNVASRLEQVAEPGTIVIGERTARSVRTHFELRALESLMVKGKAGSLTAFLVEGERDAVAPELRAPLVGRETEFKKLQVALQHVRQDRKAQVVGLVGEAGAGKSRLLEEFVTSSAAETRVTGGRCLPYGRGVTLWPLREILRGEAGLLSSDDGSAARAKIEQLVERELPEAALDRERAVAALAATIGLEDAVAGDPREVYRELVRAWRSLLAAMAETRPLIVSVEDVHWADETTLELIAELIERIKAPILFVCSMRPDLMTTHAEWMSSLHAYSAIHLDALPEEASDQLVSELLKTGSLSATLKERILTSAEGNPFFIEEILRRLVDEGSLVHRDEGWELGAEVSEVQIPDNVQAVILARLDLLEADERAAIQLAAVVGRTFWDGALRRLTPDRDTEAILKKLRRREFINEKLTSAVAGQTEYRFKHLLTRDVAYESLPRKARGAAHVAVAGWIEQTVERPNELAEVIAHHYERGFRLLGGEEARVRARSYCLEAARNALQRFAIAQAESLGRRAVELSTEGAERVEALDELGDLYVLTFKSDGAWEAYRAAMREIDPNDASQTPVFAHLAAKATIVPTRWRGTMENLPDVGELAELIDDGLAAAGDIDSADRSLLLSSKAFLLGVWYEKRGEDYAREALAIAERIGNGDLASVAIDAAVVSLMAEGRWGEMYRLDSKRVELVPSFSDVREVADAYAMTAESCRTVGHYGRAIEFARQGIERSRGLDAGSYLHNLVERTYAQFFVGAWDDALAGQAEIERLQAEHGALPGPLAMWAYGVALLCSELRAEPERVARYLNVVDEFNRHSQAAGRRFNSYLGLPARAVAHRGGYEQARGWLTTERSYFLSAHLEALTEILIAQRDWVGARDVIARARDEAEIGELRALPLFADRLEGIVLLESDDHDGLMLLHRSTEGFAELGAPWERAYSELLLGERLLDMDRKDEAERVLNSAAAIFDLLGSVREAETAAKLLAEV
ncbi:MAG: adenylate/guanylate cyclase domain-containing protein [Actinomycetota bacterium]